jgi:hypothetical protein
MTDHRPGVVEIFREFFAVHARMADLVDHYQSRTLSFELVEDLVGDDNSSALYRLKEKCHALFRSSATDEAAEVRTEALFDLVIGSLFHEAMILRENLYQQERYGPRVDALKENENPLAPELSRELDRIVTSSASRLEEAVGEVEVLLALASAQFLRLLTEESENDLLARCLYEERESVVRIFRSDFEVLLDEVYGSVSDGLMRAANSYIESAYYDDALQILSQVPEGDVAAASAFAMAMQAFLARDYARCAECLSRWLTTESVYESTSRMKLAVAAAKYVDKVQEGLLSAESIKLLARMGQRLGGASSTAES